VYADGVELDDSFIAEEMKTSGDGTYEVPEDCYFMMGDNRNHSLDSRFWDNKYVPLENIVAKAKLRLAPFQSFGTL
jgi:signal peptidase I